MVFADYILFRKIVKKNISLKQYGDGNVIYSFAEGKEKASSGPIDSTYKGRAKNLVELLTHS